MNFELVKHKIIDNKKKIIIGSSVLTGVIITGLIVKNTVKNTVKSIQGQKIILIAQKYVGKKEIQPNKGFIDKSFEQKMKNTGWLGERIVNGEKTEGQPWCAYFVKLVLLESFKDEKRNAIRKLTNGSTVWTFEAFKKNENKVNWFYISKKPTQGAIAFWKSQTKEGGHFAIVKSVTKKGFYSIDGNSGQRVRIVKRSFAEFKKTTGNKLIGFVNFK